MTNAEFTQPFEAQRVMSDDELRASARVNDICDTTHEIESIPAGSRLRFHQLLMEETGGAAYGD